MASGDARRPSHCGAVMAPNWVKPGASTHDGFVCLLCGRIEGGAVGAVESAMRGARSGPSVLEAKFAEALAPILARECLPLPRTEYRFDNARRWRFDFAWPQYKVAVELDGGTFSGGRHTRGGGFAKDTEKTNAAAVAGWTVLRYPTGSDWPGVVVAVASLLIERRGCLGDPFKDVGHGD